MRALVLFALVITPVVLPGCSCSSSDTPPTMDSGPRDAPPLPDAAIDALPIPDAPGSDVPGMTDAPACADADGDGVTVCAGDCDDADPLSATGFLEVCGDGADNDCDGTPDDGCTGGIGTFVSALTGSDANPGTRALPVATITRGIANAVTLGAPQAVIVAEGTYAEKVTMVEGVDLLGGHDCSASPCTWALDPATNVSAIANTDFEGVLAPATVTPATLLEGFTVTGRSGTASAPGSAAITLAGGCPTIRGNTIVGGDVTGGGFGADRSVGILLRPTASAAGVLIEGNDITGGTSSNATIAILFDWMGAGMMRALATVRGNVLRGGTGQHSVGLEAWISAPGTLVTDNDIFAGPSTGGRSHGIEVGSTMTIDGNRINADPALTGGCTSPTGFCAGISSESSTTTITNNVIYGPPGPRSAGVLLGEFEVPAGVIMVNGNFVDGGGSGPGVAATESAAVVVTIGPCTTCGFRGEVGRIRNNILLGGMNTLRYGVLEAPSAGRQMSAEALANNVIFFATAAGRTDVLYRQISAAGTPTDLTTLAAVNALTMRPVAAANLGADPLVDATWHLMTGSPCIDAGTATEAPSIDFEGDTRPGGSAIDVGADEI